MEPRTACRPPLLAALALVCAASMARAQTSDFNFERDCAPWIEKHGYSADYIKLKAGKRQRGQPQVWRGNVAVHDVQPGDVVLTLIRDKGKGMRAALVEEIRRNPDGSPGAVFVSEWNVGPYINEPCFVTDHFGRLAPPRPVTAGEVVRVWRPSLPLGNAVVTE